MQTRLAVGAVSLGHASRPGLGLHSGLDSAWVGCNE